MGERRTHHVWRSLLVWLFTLENEWKDTLEICFTTACISVSLIFLRMSMLLVLCTLATYGSSVQDGKGIPVSSSSIFVL